MNAALTDASSENESPRDGIVARLRNAFLAIGLLLCLAGAGSFILLSQLNTAQRQLTHGAVPDLSNSQKLIRHLAKVLVTTSELRTAPTPEAVATLILVQADHLDDLWHSARAEKQPQTRLVGSDSLAEFEAASRTIGPVRYSLLRQTSEIATLQNRLANMRLDIRDVTQPVLTNIALLLQQALDTVSSQATTAGVQTTNLITELATSERHIANIVYRMNSAIDLAEQISVQSDSAILADRSLRLRFILRSVSQALIQLPRDASTKALARFVNQFRYLIFGSTGIIQQLEMRANTLSALQTAELTQARLADYLSELVDKHVAETQIIVSDTSDDFDTTLVRTLLLLGVTGMFLMGIIWLVNRYVVEKQINRRISELTKAVLDIAAGDTSRESHVTGSDELGAMASALGVFKKNARELIRSNEELEKFAYAASHDLRSPLRAIENLAQWTIEDAGDQLPETCNDNLNKLLDRAKRLSRLQTDLLEYSRAGRSESGISETYLPEMISELTDLVDPDGNFLVSFEGSIARFGCVETALRQILMNLITNAIKHHDRPQGRIKISTTQIADRIHFQVSDDGPGIPVEYHERVFGLFQTLRSRDEVEGSGLGLSLIKKLVEGYGGNIRLDSDPVLTRGTTFSFDMQAVTTSDTTGAVDPLTTNAEKVGV